MEIGEKIKQLRTEKKMSQKELALKIGVTQTNVAYFESRGNAITLENIFKIATALEVSIKSLLFDDIDYTDVPISKEIENLLLAKNKEIEGLGYQIISLNKEIELLSRELQVFQKEKKLKEFQEAILSIIPLDFKEQIKSVFSEENGVIEIDVKKFEETLLNLQNSPNGKEFEEKMGILAKKHLTK